MECFHFSEQRFPRISLNNASRWRCSLDVRQSLALQLTGDIPQCCQSTTQLQSCVCGAATQLRAGSKSNIKTSSYSIEKYQKFPYKFFWYQHCYFLTLFKLTTCKKPPALTTAHVFCDLFSFSEAIVLVSVLPLKFSG